MTDFTPIRMHWEVRVVAGPLPFGSIEDWYQFFCRGISPRVDLVPSTLMSLFKKHVHRVAWVLIHPPPTKLPSLRPLRIPELRGFPDSWAKRRPTFRGLGLDHWLEDILVSAVSGRSSFKCGRFFPITLRKGSNRNLSRPFRVITGVKNQDLKIKKE